MTVISSHSLYRRLPGQKFGHMLPMLLFIACLFVACGGSNQSNAPDAHQLILKAQTAIQQVTSYHFNLAVDNPGSGSALTVTSADGDILVPDKLKAKATVLASGASIQVNMIAIGAKQYVTNPFTGAWQPTTGLLDPRSLSDPQTGVAAILGHLQNPSTPTDSSVDGVSCWSIDGQLDPKYLAGITGGGVPTGNLVNTTICIGKSDNLPYLIRISGIAAQGDTSKTVRTFKLSKFGETLNITAPM